MFSCIYTGGLSVSFYFVVFNYAIRETYLSVSDYILYIIPGVGM